MSTRNPPRKDALVADGTEFYRRMLAELLRGHGWNVTEADSCGPALELLERDRPDVVFLDLALPPSGSREFLDQARARGWHGLRVVGIGQSFYDEAEIDQLKARGVAAFVSRSSPIDDLLVAARVALFPEQKNLRRSPRAQVQLPVTYRAEDERGEPGEEIATHTFNLSADGAFLTATTHAPRPPGSRLELRFWLPGAPELITTEGVVIWCNQAGARVNELYPPGMGVMFVGLRREGAALIADYVRGRALNPFL